LLAESAGLCGAASGVLCSGEQLWAGFRSDAEQGFMTMGCGQGRATGTDQPHKSFLILFFKKEALS
jgi:hypothetical protein